MIRNVMQKDKTPIAPVLRPDLLFQMVDNDIIGPFEPPSSKGHRFVLCLVDQHTRWAETVPLTSSTAKATCEVLLTIFKRTGVPNVIASDNGTYFNSQLTEEFERRTSESLRFFTPLYPQSNGLVERFIKILKGMLHHAIREEPRNWHAKLPFILWAYREIPNRTTGGGIISIALRSEIRGSTVNFEEHVVKRAEGSSTGHYSYIQLSAKA